MHNLMYNTLQKSLNLMQKKEKKQFRSTRGPLTLFISKTENLSENRFYIMLSLETLVLGGSVLL